MSNPASNLAERAQSGRPISVLSGRGSQMGRRTPTAWTTADENVPDGSVRDLEAFERDDVQFATNAQSDVVPEPERSGCWHSFTRGIRGLWSTRQMKKGIEDREWIVRTTLRELLVYSVFLTILCVLTFGMASPNMYYQTKVLSELFLDSTFPNGASVKTSTQMNDFWGFAQSAMVDGLYWEHWYNSNVTTPDDRNILFENRLLGSPRLRQLRVLNDSCKVHEDFKRAIAQCYNHYSPHIEDPSPFGLMNGSAWFYHTEKQMNGSNHWGLLASYSGAGSFMDLGITKAVAKERVKELYDNLWVSRATRAVFLDFTTYNANLNLFCIVKILFEFPATGGMLTSWTFRTVKLIRYVTTMDFFVMGCEGLFVLFIIYYCIEEAIEIRNNKCSYFKSVWNILDLTVIFISLICICFSVYRTMMVDSLLRGLLENPDIFADFEFLGFWQTQFNNMVAIAVFFAWVKIFKYISFNKTMTQLSSTLSRCSKDVAGFAVMFFIVFFAFAQLGYLLFGTQINDYRSFTRTIFTLLRLILGDFSFTDLEAANRVLGPLYFLSFVFFVFFVLMNMFLAIINDTYAEVKEEIANQKNEFEIGDYFKKGYNNILTKLGKRDHLKNMENALKMADSDGDKKLTYDEVRKKLKEQNFSDMEIDMVFAKYDLDGNLELDENEMQQMFSDLEGERNKLDWEIKKEGTGQFDRPDSAAEEHHSGPGVSLDDFNVLSRRVDRMEHSIGSIVSKIDAVLVKMEAMERAKTKRRDNMNKILDSVNQNNGLDDRGKRQEMEKRVREELQRWDSEASLNSPQALMKLPHSGT